MNRWSMTATSLAASSLREENLRKCKTYVKGTKYLAAPQRVTGRARTPVHLSSA